MKIDLERVREAAEKASDSDLLDRVTLYRAGVEPAALEVLEEVLRDRKISEEEVRRHGEDEGRGVLWERPGLAVQCAFCRRAAIRLERRWYRFLGLIPLYPCDVACCAAHQQSAQRSRDAPVA